MGLQNKGCRHSDVQQKRNSQTSIFWKTEKRQKYCTNKITSCPSIWKDNCDLFFLTNAHEDVLVRAPLSRGAHHKTKPAAVLDYKYGVERSDQMLSHYSFERKKIKLWRKLFFRLFNLVVVNAHILHNKSSKKNMLLEIF
jgi:hypothetical protein